MQAQGPEFLFSESTIKARQGGVCLSGQGREISEAQWPPYLTESMNLDEFS